MIFYIKIEDNKCFVYDNNKNIITKIDDYLLRTIKYDTSENQIIFEYIHKVVIFNLATKIFLEKSNEKKQ